MKTQKSYKIGFLGAGQLAQNIVSSLLVQGYDPKSITMSNRGLEKLQCVQEQLGVNIVKTNVELLAVSDILMLATKPQDLKEAVAPIGELVTSPTMVISLVAGINLNILQSLFPFCRNMYRVMLNLAVSVQSGVVGYCSLDSKNHGEVVINDLFSSMGRVFAIPEGKSFEAFTVGTSSGIGFVYELMILWQRWMLDHGFCEADARDMVWDTFMGALLLVKKEGQSFESLQRQVMSKKGVTEAGLLSLKEMGLERILRTSFAKATLKDRQLGQGLADETL